MYIYISPNPIFKINQRSVGVARIVVCSGMLKKFWVWRIFTRGAWVYARIVVCSEKINKNVLGLKNISEDNCDLDSGSWWLKTNIIVARVQTSDFESWQVFFQSNWGFGRALKFPTCDSVTRELGDVTPMPDCVSMATPVTFSSMHGPRIRFPLCLLVLKIKGHEQYVCVPVELGREGAYPCPH